jgi:CubicO group peptidase (beta-lactamase class C family)
VKRQRDLLMIYIRSRETDSWILTTLTMAIIGLTLSCGQAEQKTNRFDEFVSQAEQAWHFQGSYLVAEGDSILARGARGLARRAEETPNTPETSYHIGSVTKLFTAVATLKIARQGRLDLDDPITDYLSASLPGNADRITIKHLLEHSSGIPDYNGIDDYAERALDLDSVEEILALFKMIPLEFEPGSRQTYSSPGYLFLGKILEEATGRKYTEIIHQMVVETAHLSATGYFSDYLGRSNHAIGYFFQPTGDVVTAQSLHFPTAYSAGALSSTVDDLFRFCRALRRGDLCATGALAELTTDCSDSTVLGFRRRCIRGHLVFGHSGGAPGYNATVQMWPQDSLIVIVLSNNGRVHAELMADTLALIALSDE